MAKGKMKAWYDDIDAATLQRIKTYSAFNDAKSKNLMMQTMYEYREKEIQDFKETNHELAETCIARKKRIAELEKENTDLKAQIEKMKCCENCRHSDTECEGHTICTIGHFYECLGNKIFDHTSDEKDYWEENEND